MHTVDRLPAPPVAVPERFAPNAVAEERLEAPDRWWRAFNDAELDGLVDAALAGNLDLRRGWARLAQIQAIARGAESGYWPQITADAGVGGQRSVMTLGPPIGRISNTQASYTLGVGVRYEVDLWGKVSSAEDAAAFEAQATRQDLESAAMTISSRAAELWLAIVGERAGLALLEAQARATQELVTLVELRFSQGLASALEVLQQRQQLVTIEAQRPLIAGRVAIAQQQLAVLLGRAPGSLPPIARAQLPALPAAPAAGLPVDLLGRRPDVRSARLRVVAADYKVGAALADRYPALSLTGRIGLQAADLAELLESWVWSLAASLTAPLVDGGRRAAEVDRTRAARDDSLLGYGQAVLQAVLEVEGALSNEDQQRAYLAAVDAQLALARRALDEAERRYVNGLTDYLSVLTTLRTVQQAEQTRLGAERQLLGYRVQLYRALGGAWTRELALPEPIPTPAAGGPR